eukprot:3080519-Rhodomonas_salina.2
MQARRALLGRSGWDRLLVERVPVLTSSFLKPGRGCQSRGGSVVRFKDVFFAHSLVAGNLLEDVNFSIRQGSKVTIMGQNGAGKSTIIKLLSRTLSPDSGDVHVGTGETVACSLQTMPAACRDMTVTQFFASQFDSTRTQPSKHELEAKMARAMNEVLFEAPCDRIIKSFSGGQQARLLLAAALIHNPSILLLDEPTNNLDHSGLDHLEQMIKTSDKTCVVISHDEDFLNGFTDQVLYLDIHSRKVEVYNGDYFFVKEEIAKRIKQENAKNARLVKAAQAKKDQANVFANKGGGMRKVAKTMREAAAALEEDFVDVRREDVALRAFTIPFTPATGVLMEISHVTSFDRSAAISGGPVLLEKGSRVQVLGPNGIGKTTFLEMLAAGTAPGVTLNEECRVGYYRQDFHTFDFESTVLESMEKHSRLEHSQQDIRAVAAKFLLRDKQMYQRVKTLSEGQKALLSLACLYLQQPSVIILDEPTNHVNFRHLPALAKAIKTFHGAVLLVSHDANFLDALGIETVIDMGKLLSTDSAANAGSDKPAQINPVKTAKDKRQAVAMEPKQTASKVQKSPKRLQKIEKNLQRLWASIATIDAQMMKQPSDVAALLELQAQRDAAAAKIEAFMLEWEEFEQAKPLTVG